MRRILTRLCVSCRDLGLKRPIYQQTAENGHFGHDQFPWEQPKQLFVEKATQEKLQNLSLLT